MCKSRIFILIVVMGLLAIAPAALAAKLSDNSGFGVFSYDSRMAFSQKEAEVFPEEHREICSAHDLMVVDQSFAEMFKLSHDEVCSDTLLVRSSTSRSEGVCSYREQAGMEPAYLDEGGLSVEAALVSLDLTSFRMNERAERAVQRNINRFMGRSRKTFSIYLSRATRFTRLMKGILREEGIPEDMVYLVLVESGFSTHAYSPSRASGPWQFMPATARRYRLKIDQWVDERRDPVKSTYAAAKYLNYLHDLFDSWSLAMAAYNAGEGRIRGALRRSKSKDYWSLIGTRYIMPETQNYVPKFIAARMLAVAPGKFGFSDIQYQEDFVFDEVVLKKQMTLQMAARCAEVSVKEIKKLNPELRRDRTPPREYRLRIPRGSREQFVLNVIRLADKNTVDATLYTVKAGDSLDIISSITGVPGDLIVAYNKLGFSPMLEEGQTLLLPPMNN